MTTFLAVLGRELFRGGRRGGLLTLIALGAVALGMFSLENASGDSRDLGVLVGLALFLPILAISAAGAWVEDHVTGRIAFDLARPVPGVTGSLARFVAAMLYCLLAVTALFGPLALSGHDLLRTLLDLDPEMEFLVRLPGALVQHPEPIVWDHPIASPGGLPIPAEVGIGLGGLGILLAVFTALAYFSLALRARSAWLLGDVLAAPIVAWAWLDLRATWFEQAAWPALAATDLVMIVLLAASLPLAVVLGTTVARRSAPTAHAWAGLLLWSTLLCGVLALQLGAHAILDERPDGIQLTAFPKPVGGHGWIVSGMRERWSGVATAWWLPGEDREPVNLGPAARRVVSPESTDSGSVLLAVLCEEESPSSLVSVHRAGCKLQRITAEEFEDLGTTADARSPDVRQGLALSPSGQHFGALRGDILTYGKLGDVRGLRTVHLSPEGRSREISFEGEDLLELRTPIQVPASTGDARRSLRRPRSPEPTSPTALAEQAPSWRPAPPVDIARSSSARLPAFDPMPQIAAHHSKAPDASCLAMRVQSGSEAGGHPFAWGLQVIDPMTFEPRYTLAPVQPGAEWQALPGCLVLLEKPREQFIRDLSKGPTKTEPSELQLIGPGGEVLWTSHRRPLDLAGSHLAQPFVATLPRPDRILLDDRSHWSTAVLDAATGDLVEAFEGLRPLGDPDRPEILVDAAGRPWEWSPGRARPLLTSILGPTAERRATWTHAEGTSTTSKTFTGDPS